jgi:hypothetical protein
LTFVRVWRKISEEKANMISAAALRVQIEQSMEHRFPAALTPVSKIFREVAATGIAEVDRLLKGGLPVGAISELTGPASSGRTSLAHAFLARRTAEGSVVAWVDSDDTFDPESAAANQVSLKQLLWVRCQSGICAEPAVASAHAMRRKPRSRRGSRVDQALMATDLLLQAGGFAAIVLDLGGTDPEIGYRIPLASWFRFRQAADRTRTSLVVLGEASYAQSSAEAVLECSTVCAQTAGSTVLDGMRYQVQRSRQRFDHRGIAELRKQPVSAWSAAAAWNVGKSA